MCCRFVGTLRNSFLGTYQKPGHVAGKKKSHLTDGDPESYFRFWEYRPRRTAVGLTITTWRFFFLFFYSRKRLFYRESRSAVFDTGGAGLPGRGFRLVRAPRKSFFVFPRGFLNNFTVILIFFFVIRNSVSIIVKI